MVKEKQKQKGNKVRQVNKIKKIKPTKKIKIIIFSFLLFNILFCNKMTVLGNVEKATNADTWINTDIESEETNNNEVANVSENVSDTFKLDEYVLTVDEYVKKSGIEDISINDFSEDLLNGNKSNYNKIIYKIVSFFTKEIVLAIKGAINIFIIVIIMAIISSLELDKDSEITKIASLICFLILATITITTFTQIIQMFSSVIGSLTTIMQVISPFLMAVLISTGAITSTGLIQPLLLFIASAIGFIINYIVIPCISISVALNVISALSQNFKLDKMSKFFSNTSIWVVGVSLTVFLGILSLETTLTSSVDSLTVKATQTAVSNFVPVVGKFFSDSFETVVGATKIIGNVGGILGIIAMILIVMVPIFKIASVMIVYNLLVSFIEPIYSDDNILKYISNFASVYKTLLGILIGVAILFIISTGIILNLIGKIVT